MFIKDKSLHQLINSPGKTKSGVVVELVAPDNRKAIQCLT